MNNSSSLSYKYNHRTGILTIIAVIAIQLSLGILYLWSIFQPGISSEIFDGRNDQAALTFSIMLASVGIGSVIGGKLASKFGLRKTVFAGGLIVSTGFFVSSWVSASFGWLLWVSYGAMGGIGMGFTYSTTISCVQKCFPHKKALVTGIVISALGFGGVVFAPILRAIVDNSNSPTGELNTFLILSIIFLAVCSVASLFLRTPSNDNMHISKNTTAIQNAQQNTDATGNINTSISVTQQIQSINQDNQLTPTQTLKTLRFYLITVTFLLACMAGVMVTGFATQIAVSRELFDPLIGVMFITLFNSVGRLVVSIVAGKLGSTKIIIAMLLLTALVTPFLSIIANNWIYVLFSMIAFMFGGIISIFPTMTAELFGSKHLATTYGFVLLGFGIGAIASTQIGGLFMNSVYIGEGMFDINALWPAFLTVSVCSVLGAMLMIATHIIQKHKNKSLSNQA